MVVSLLIQVPRVVIDVAVVVIGGNDVRAFRRPPKINVLYRKAASYITALDRLLRDEDPPMELLQEVIRECAVLHIGTVGKLTKTWMLENSAEILAMSERWQVLFRLHRELPTAKRKKDFNASMRDMRKRMRVIEDSWFRAVANQAEENAVRGNQRRAVFQIVQQLAKEIPQHGMHRKRVSGEELEIDALADLFGRILNIQRNIDGTVLDLLPRYRPDEYLRK